VDALQIVRFINMVPQPFLPKNSMTTLTSINFASNLRFMDAVKSLFIFLKSTPPLQSLNIHAPARTHFSPCSQERVGDLGFASELESAGEIEVVLPHLRQPDFHLYSEVAGDLHAAYLSQVVTVLAMPALSSVSVHFNYFATPCIRGNIPRNVSRAGERSSSRPSPRAFAHQVGNRPERVVFLRRSRYHSTNTRTSRY